MSRGPDGADGADGAGGAGPGEGLAGLGEFGVIELFRPAGPLRHPGWSGLGIGDDCAVIRPAAGEELLVSTDLLLEGVHFLVDRCSPWQLGYKALAVNLSDLAAMGATARGAWLALGLRPELGREYVVALRDGLRACAERYGVDLLGGDTVGAPGGLVLGLTVIGVAPAGQAVRRSGARAGDRLAVGGVLGDSAAGLELLLHGEPGTQAQGAAGVAPGGAGGSGAGGEAAAADWATLRRAHLEPRPQLGLGRWLAERGLATAMLDVSDGLLQDLSHLTAASGLGAELEAERLPLSAAARRLAAARGTAAQDWALSGGEDYVLLFALPAAREAELARCPAELGPPPTVIGTLVAEPGLRLRERGRWRTVQAAGFDHFRPR